MVSEVFFADLRCNQSENLLLKFQRLVKQAGIKNRISSNSITGIKLHFGEMGNLAYIRPPFFRVLGELLSEIGTKSFLTDANTLYGTRNQAQAHLITAYKNGFDFSSVGLPVIIADGLTGRSEVAVSINQKHFKEVYIGAEILAADNLVFMSHVKLHELTGIGGTLKNIGMGCASRRGKMAQHSGLSLKIKEDKCVACGECVNRCLHNAILMDETAHINPEKCIGCGYCLLVCPQGAIKIQFNMQIPEIMEKMMEYTLGVLQDKKNRTFFINFINSVSPACDCYGHNDAPIVKDIGMLASLDPVAIDKASVDLINAEEGFKGSALKSAFAPGSDKLKDVYPYVEWEHQFSYAEKLGLGSKDYKLVKI